MKTVIVSLMSVSVILTSMNANAMVRALNLDCEMKTVQADAPSFSLECGIIQSFGPATINCNANESWYFPTPGNKSIELARATEKSSNLSALVLKGEDLNVTLNLDHSTAVVTYLGMEYDCK